MNWRRKAARKAWLIDFELLVTREHPEWAGRIDWAAAEYLEGQGLTTTTAAERYIAAKEQQG